MIPFTPVSECKNLDTTLANILQKLETAFGTSAELLQQLKQSSDGTNSARTSVAQLQALVQDCTQEQQPILQSLEHSHAEAMLGNVAATLEDILAALDAKDAGDHGTGAEQAAYLCEFQLIPQLRITRESFYFWGYIDKSAPLRKQYYASEFAAHYQNQYVANNDALPYQVSVVVVAFNKLDMTKQCVNSILENTDFAKLNAELILVDNGSSDGTLEFFKSVPQAKVIHFKHNMHIASFTMLPMICRSKYFAFVANDTVATKDWLEILMSCVQSDSKIAIAAPATTNISNWQGLNVPTDDCAELVEIAKQHNKVNPLLWRERSMIYPPMGVLSLEAINQLGFWDPAFYSFYCADDDFSVRARKAGFRQILCEDVFCFHKSKGTLSNKSSQGFYLGRDLFKRKHGFEPWVMDAAYNPTIVKFLTKHCPDQSQINVLSLNSGIGDSLLQVKNLLQETGKKVSLYHILTQDKFVDDIKHTAAGIEMVPAKALPQAVATCFPDVKFDLICSANACNHAQLTPDFLSNLSSRLVDHGAIALTVDNPVFINKVIQALSLGIPVDKIQSIDGATLKAMMQPYFKHTDVKVVEFTEANYDDMAKVLHHYKIELNDALYAVLKTQAFLCLTLK